MSHPDYLKHLMTKQGILGILFFLLCSFVIELRRLGFINLTVGHRNVLSTDTISNHLLIDTFISPLPPLMVGILSPLVVFSILLGLPLIVSRYSPRAGIATFSMLCFGIAVGVSVFLINVYFL